MSLLKPWKEKGRRGGGREGRRGGKGGGREGGEGRREGGREGKRDGINIISWTKFQLSNIIIMQYV